MKKLIYILICLLCTIAASMSAHNATNVQVLQSGKNIVITYDLDEPSLVELRVTYEDPGLLEMNQSLYLFQVNADGSINQFAVSGDVGQVNGGTGKRIVWNVLKDHEKFVFNNVQFFVEAHSLYTGVKTFILGEYGYSFNPQHSGGLMVGQVYKYAGWYLNARSCFSFAQPTDGLTSGAGGYVDGAMPFYTGQSKNCHYVFNAGVVWDMSFNHWDKSMIALYLGGGYGSRYSLWQTMENQWIKYGPTAYSGVSVQAGIIGAVKGFTMNVGVTTIAFKYMEIEAGIGWTIPQKRRVK
ncbi:MAG: hypothetical protein J6X51_05820 [Bacteroidales bacterium]|nr:hypothetical protein [Bacteroidales bacterium]